MGVVRSDQGQRVLLARELACSLNGVVEHHGLSERQVSCAGMVAMVDAAACRKARWRRGDP